MDEIKEMLRRIEQRLANIEQELMQVRNDTRTDGVKVVTAAIQRQGQWPNSYGSGGAGG